MLWELRVEKLRRCWCEVFRDMGFGGWGAEFESADRGWGSEGCPCLWSGRVPTEEYVSKSERGEGRGSDHLLRSEDRGFEGLDVQSLGLGDSNFRAWGFKSLGQNHWSRSRMSVPHRLEGTTSMILTTFVQNTAQARVLTGVCVPSSVESGRSKPLDASVLSSGRVPTEEHVG